MKPWIGIAVLDWVGEGIDDLYPDDVPNDWQLTWLANLVMSVVLPPTRWQRASEAQIRAWVEDTQDNFWFYLLCETPEQLEQAHQIASCFGQQFGGIIITFSVEAADTTRPYDLLTLGQEVLNYQADTLRQGQQQIRTWRDGFTGNHGLILLSGKYRRAARDLHALLALLGVTND
jgi:hypothetical protein